MNRHHLRRPGRGTLLVGLCLLALIPLALAPALLLRLTDLYTLGRVQAVTEPYAPQAQSMEDFYLLRQLAQRGGNLAAGRDDPLSSDIYAPAAVDRSAMSFDVSMGTYALDLMREMADAGALPESWLQVLCGLVEMRDNGYGNGMFYYSSDSLGFIEIHGYNGSQGSHLLFAMTVESHTGHVVRLWLGLPADSDVTPVADTRAVLAAFVAFNGLDTLGDWAPPAGSAYEQNGLYSAAGQVLAVCARYDFTYNGPDFWTEALYYQTADTPAPERSDWPYIALDLSLTWSADVPLLLESGPRRDDALPYAIGELQPLQGGGERIATKVGDGSALYELAACAGSEYSGALARTEYATTDREIYCSVAGCAHDTLACPARLPYIWLAQKGLFFAQDKLWLLLDAGADTEDRAAARQALMELLGAGNEAQLDEVLQQLPDLFSSDDLGYFYSQAQPATLELVEPNGRTVVQTLPDGVSWRWHDEEALFGLRLDTAAGTAALVRVPFAGEVTETPLPNAKLLLRASQIEVCGGKLLLALNYAPTPGQDPVERISGALPVQRRSALVRYDPATGASELLRKDEGGTALGIAAVWPGQLVLTDIGGGFSIVPLYFTPDVERLTAFRLPESGPLQLEGVLDLRERAAWLGYAVQDTTCLFTPLPKQDLVYVLLRGPEGGAEQSTQYLFAGTGQVTTIASDPRIREKPTFLDSLPDGRVVVEYTDSTSQELCRTFLTPKTGALDDARWPCPAIDLRAG